MRRYSLLPLFILICVISKAQSKNGQINGAIKDANQKVVPSATVALLNAKDSSVAKYAISDKQGDFEFDKISDGKYLVSISATGSPKAFSQIFELSSVNNRIDLGNFELVQQSTELGVVTVTSTRPPIENKIDKTVVNVDASITNGGLSAMDILEKAPGVLVDNNNNTISLKGKSGVIILIDNKQTYLSGQDLVNYLKSLTAAQLDQIEIMSQPPAKYDASGNSGLINIKTKKGTQRGYNGSVSLSYIQANYPKFPTSFNMNYRQGKVNFFGQYSYTYWQGFNKIKLERYFGRESEDVFNSLIKQEGFIRFHSNTHSFKAGADYFVNKKTTLGFVFNGTINSSSSRTDTKSDIFNDDHDLTSYNRAYSTNGGPWNNYALNLNFRTVLDKKGKELSGDIDGVYYKNSADQISNNYNYNPDGTLSTPAPNQPPNPFLLSGYLPGKIQIATAKLDYSQPLKGGAKFEAGIKSGYVKNDNDANYSFYNGTAFVYDSSRSNHFIYQENVNAAYVNFSKQWEKWGIQLGLRTENTNIKGNQVVKNSKFDSSYIQLFPTMYVSYAIDKVNNLGLSFGRRIDRPSYQDMNPFQFILDQYTYRQGNPYLKPQTSNNIELSYNYKGQLNVSVNYTRITNIISDVLKQNDASLITFQTKENVASSTNIGLSASYNKTLKKWWTIALYTNVFNNHYSGVLNDQPLSVDIPTYVVNVNSQFKFNKGWGLEVSGFYRSKVLAGGMIIGKSMGQVSFGASKQILKGKGSLRLNLTDPFWLQYFRGYVKFGNVYTHINNHWDNRRVTLTFTYRFAKGKSQPQTRRRTSASQDEQNRIGGQSNQ